MELTVILWLVGVGVPAVFGVVYLFVKKFGNDKQVAFLDKLKEFWKKLNLKDLLTKFTKK